MAVFTYTREELRDIHDWNNPFRPVVDTIELLVLIPLTLFGCMLAISGKGMWTDEEGTHSPPIWELFTSWRAFSHLVVGALVVSACLLLLRDWWHGLEERHEEQKRRKVYEEEWRRDKEKQGDT